MTTMASRPPTMQILKQRNFSLVLKGVRPKYRLKSTLSVADKDTGVVKEFDDIPGPSGVLSVPYLGMGLQLHPFTDFKPNRFDLLIKKYHDDFGKICKVRTNPDWLVYVFDPDDIQKVLRNDRKYPLIHELPLFQVYNKRTNRIPTMAERQGEEWWELRSPAQKCMARPKAMAMFIPKLSVIADDFINNCRKTNRIENLPFPLMQLSIESVGMLCFNTRLGCLDQSDSLQGQILTDHVRCFFQYLGEQIFTPINWFKWFKTPGYRKFEEANDYIMDLADKHVARCAQEIHDNEVREDDTHLIRNLLRCPGMTAEKTVPVLIDLLRAGIETTANSMAFLLYRLAKHPEKQEILYEELAGKMQTSGVMDENSLYNMPYLRACLKESMRLVYPVIMGSSRRLDKDIEIQGYRVPAGVEISLCTGITSLSETFFHNPQDFIPERWLRNHGEKRSTHPFAYMPFGFGSRMCLGQRFAENQIQINTAKLLRNFRISLPSSDTRTELAHVYGAFATVEKPFDLLLEARN